GAARADHASPAHMAAGAAVVRIRLGVDLAAIGVVPIAVRRSYRARLDLARGRHALRRSHVRLGRAWAAAAAVLDVGPRIHTRPAASNLGQRAGQTAGAHRAHVPRSAGVPRAPAARAAPAGGTAILVAGERVHALRVADNFARRASRTT